MGHAGQKIGLRPIGDLGGFFGPEQGLLSLLALGDIAGHSHDSRSPAVSVTEEGCFHLDPDRAAILAVNLELERPRPGRVFCPRALICHLFRIGIHGHLEGGRGQDLLRTHGHGFLDAVASHLGDGGTDVGISQAHVHGPDDIGQVLGEEAVASPALFQSVLCPPAFDGNPLQLIDPLLQLLVNFLVAHGRDPPQWKAGNWRDRLNGLWLAFETPPRGTPDSDSGSASSGPPGACGPRSAIVLLFTLYFMYLAKFSIKPRVSMGLLM